MRNKDHEARLLNERARQLWPDLPELPYEEVEAKLLDELTRRIRTQPDHEQHTARLIDRPVGGTGRVRYFVHQVDPAGTAPYHLRFLPGERHTGLAGFDAIRARTAAAAILYALDLTEWWGT